MGASTSTGAEERDPVAVLRRAFGYPGFRPGQEELVRAVLSGRDALGVLPTGGGKSVCYQVPALIVDGLTLVVTPLISLMEDQVGRARTVGLRADFLSATRSVGERRAVAARAESSALDLLFVSPERLETDAFRALVDGVRIDLLAVDEAHCISEWGHDFRPAYRRIGALRRCIAGPTLALTASATPPVRADIRASLGLADPFEIVRSFDRSNLWWSVERGGTLPERLQRIHALVRREPGCSIVYAPTRRTVERVRASLARAGVVCAAYHAGLGGDERTRVQERFLGGDVRVVVATNAFGMGIDKPDVRLVVHLQLPTTLEAYYQEAGRAGRDGAPSRCIALHGPHDGRLGRAFRDRTHPPLRRLRALHRTLRAAAGEDGRVRVDDPRVVCRLGSVPRGWMRGEPEGALAALERAGALRRMGSGTDGRSHGSPEGDAVVVRRFDADRVARRRAVVTSKLRAVERYARVRGCRTAALLRYFGEVARQDCGRCDRCGWDSRVQP